MSEAVLDPEIQDNENPVSITNGRAVVRELQPKEATFARLVASGLPKGTAYIQAGYNACDSDSASSAGCQLASRPRVAEYLKQLREAAFTANVLSLAEKRDFLARAVRTPISGISTESDLAQGAKYDAQTGQLTELKIPDKLKALELDAKLAGELKEQTQVSQTFNFALLGDRSDEGLEAEVIELPSSPDTSSE